MTFGFPCITRFPVVEQGGEERKEEQWSNKTLFLKSYDDLSLKSRIVETEINGRVRGGGRTRG